MHGRALILEPHLAQPHLITPSHVPRPRRYFVREQQETQVSQVELFLNSVPILAPLSRDERLRLVDALEEMTFPAGSKVGSWQEGKLGRPRLRLVGALEEGDPPSGVQYAKLRGGVGCQGEFEAGEPRLGSQSWC